MSLDTLLEAAEFIELRSQDDRYRNLHGYAKKPPATVKTELPSGTGDTEKSCQFDETKMKDFKLRGRSGKLSPIYVGPPDGFYMRRNLKGKEYAPYVSSAHNWLEKNRRAHLKECFDFLKKNIPSLEDRRTSNLGILRGSLRYIQILKRKEQDFELEMQHLSREQVILQTRILRLQNELQMMNVNVDLKALANVHENDNDTNSTSTATERGTPPPSDHSEDDDDEEAAEKLVMETNPSPIPKRPLLPKPSPKKSSAIKDLLFNGATVTPDLNVKDYPSEKIIQAVQGLISAKNLMISNTGPGSVSATTTKVPKAIPVPVRPLLSQGTVLNMPVPWKSVQGKPATATTGVPVPVAPLVSIPVPTSLAESTSHQMMAPKTPVTQILHRTLTQKALMKQEGATSYVSTTPATAARFVAPSVTNIPVTIAMAPPVTSPVVVKSEVVLNPAVTVDKPTIVSSSLADWQNKLQMASAVPLSFPYYMATSMPQFAHPILVTSLKAPTLSQAPASTGAVNTPAVPVATLTTGVIKSEPVEVNLASNPTTVVSMANTAGVTAPMQTGFPMRQIFAPNLLSGQFSLPLLAHAAPRTPGMVTTTMVTTPTTLTSQTNVSSASSHVTSVPIMSLAQINPLGQLMSPMTVMSPGVQLASAGLTSAQLNTMIAASPYLKQFSANTILPQSLLPAGQVLGQVVKPMVVVSMPGATSAVAAAAPIQTTVNVTSS